MIRKVLLVVLCLLLSASAVYAQDITITLDGSPVVFTADSGQPYMDPSGRVMTPLRVVLEKAGAHVTYDASTRGATITTLNTEVYVPVEQWIVVVNGKNKVNDAPATIRNGRIYLPIRIVMESLGYSVAWDGGNHTVSIQKNAVDLTQPTLTTTPSAPVTTPSANVAALMKPNTVGNSNVNLYNGGLIAREKNNLYYVNFDDNERIWRVDVKTGKSNVISERKARSINVVDDWVYYRQESISGIWEVWKAKVDGTAVQDIINDNTDFIRVEGNVLYYYKPATHELLKRELNKYYSTSCFNATMPRINLEDNVVTYVEMVTDSGTNTTVPGDVKQQDFNNSSQSVILAERTGDTDSVAVVSNGKLYFRRSADAMSLWSKDLLSGKLTKLNDQWSYVITADEKAAYTMYPLTNAGLYRLALDGSGQTKLNGEWSPFTYYDPYLMSSGDYLYFADRPSGSSYQWIRVNKATGDSKKIYKPEDFME